MEAGQFLERGQAVGPGGVVRCSAPDRRLPDRICGGLVGAPAIGSQLLHIMGEGEEVTRCEPRLWALKCSRCGRFHVFLTLLPAAA